jgi:hypothetical protein
MAEPDTTREASGNGSGRSLAPSLGSPPVLRTVAPPTAPAAQPMLLRIGLANSLFLLALVVARLVYHGQVHPVVYLAVALVLAVYAEGAAHALRLARTLPTADLSWRRELDQLDRLAARCPKVAMAGTVTGFLIAFSGSTDDVAQRVRGASTGLSATLVGIAAMLLLELQHDWLANRRASR